QEGELEVDSEPGKGATLSFVIPAAPADDSPQPLAVITLREPRLQSLAIGLARAAGFEVTSQLPPVESAPAVWITDPADQLASAARAFAAGRADRRVLVCAEDDSAAPEGAGVFTLSGGASLLRQELAEFLRSCARPPPREVAACQIDEGCAE